MFSSLLVLKVRGIKSLMKLPWLLVGFLSLGLIQELLLCQ